MIRGHRVNFGQPGTNDYMLARDVVSFLRLKPAEPNGGGDFTELELGKEQLTSLAQEIQSLGDASREEQAVRELPDVVLTVASLPSRLSQALLDTGEFCLVPFPYIEPYLMSNLEQITDKSGSVDRLLVESTAIHKGMYMGSNTVLREDCQTIGLRTLLVARADLPAASVKRLMQCVFESEFTRRVHPRSPREIASAFSIHPAAAAYLDRDKPLITGKFFDTASTFFSIFGTSVRACSVCTSIRSDGPRPGDTRGEHVDGGPPQVLDRRPLLHRQRLGDRLGRDGRAVRGRAGRAVRGRAGRAG